MIYDHVYPFDPSTWARPIEEWTEDRFTLLTAEQVVTLVKRDRELFKAEITAAKEASKVNK